jgi:uncharacterized protein YecT (DUF1311 family)
MMTRRAGFAVCIASLCLVGTAVRADPLLSKAQIAKAANKIEACLAKQQQARHGDASHCIGIVRGPCDDAISAGGDAAHATCSDNETAAWDVLLNRTWSELPADLGPERFAALKEVQKLWLAYRDANCAFLENLQNPSAWGLMRAADCKLDQTARRTIELREILADPNLAPQ